MDYRNGKNAQQILELQNADGTWGNEFHSFAIPTGRNPLTTEQALRRLQILGFTIEDAPIRKAVDCMNSCLRGERRIDDYWEKTMDWNLFTKLMLSTWVKIYEPDNELALCFGRQWANVIEKAFVNGCYDCKQFEEAYQQEFYQKAKGPRVTDFVTFYQINLLQGLLSKETERRMLDYVINHEGGIYYIYGKPIRELPKEFDSLVTSRYLAAIEILAGYETAGEKLQFVVEWLERSKDENGQWDLGPKAKDKVYFPLSDSWRTAEARKADCTRKIEGILQKLRER